MARSIWKRSSSFGLVNIPVALYPAENSEALHFTLLDQRDMAPVGYKRVNKNTDEEVAWDQIVKDTNTTKIKTKINMSCWATPRLSAPKATQTIEILHFIKASNIRARLDSLRRDPWTDFADVRQTLTQRMFRELGVR